MHLGHRTVLRPIVDIGRAENIPPTIVTFSPHPREFFTGEKRQLLTPLEEKVGVLAELGIEQLVLLPFTEELASLTPREFVERIIVEKLGAKWISVGEDFHFGCRRQGNATDLANFAGAFGIETRIVELKKGLEGSIDPSVRISSSLIRQALAEGDAERARQMLGRPYRLIGRVVGGKQLGRTIGFPTANLEVPENKLLPRFGVYRVLATIEGGETLAGVMNIGNRPTVAGKTVTVEVHLLDWSGQLVDRFLDVRVLQFLRPEQKFNSLDELKTQISIDCQRARKFMSEEREIALEIRAI